MIKIGEKRHMLTLIKKLGDTNRKINKPETFVCKCDCGNETKIQQSKFGVTKSCGCLKRATGENCQFFKGYKGIYGRQWWQLKKNAASRNLEFKIDMKYVWDIFLKQNKKCKLSGLDIDFGKGKTWTASIDRIDSSKGYIKGNIQILHKDVNKMKMNFEQKYFLDICNKIVTQSFREGNSGPESKR